MELLLVHRFLVICMKRKHKNLQEDVLGVMYNLSVTHFCYRIN